MKVSHDTVAATYSVTAYKAGEITVAPPGIAPDAGGRSADERAVKHLSRSFLLLPDRLIEEWPPERFEELREEHLALLLDLNPEVALIGTGAAFRFPDPAVTAPLHAAGIGVEVMDTAAACRTFNILASEGRRVAAALLML